MFFKLWKYSKTRWKHRRLIWAFLGTKARLWPLQISQAVSLMKFAHKHGGNSISICFSFFLSFFFFFGCTGFCCSKLSLVLVGFLLTCDTRASLRHSMWDLSSPTRDWTCVPCIGRQILNHGTTREVLWILTFEKIESQLFSTSLLSTHLSEFVFSQLQHGVEETAAECRKLGATTHVFVVDCSNREEIYSSVDQVRLQRTHFSPWFYVPLHGIWKGSLWQPNLNLIFF